MKLRKKYLCAAIAVSLSQSAFAEQESDTMTIWSSPVSATTTILGQSKMKDLDKQNVGQALSVIPGVTLQKSGARNELLVKVRGLDSRQVPIFFDGVPIYIPYDGNLDLSRFLTSNIESIEVAKGYSSLLQGPNQMGGAINITTKKPTKPLEASIGYRQGWSRGKDNARDMHASVGASNDLGFVQLSGSKLKQDFLGLPHGVKNHIAGRNGKMINSSADDKRGIIKLGFTPRANDEYTLTYIKQDGAKDNPPYAGTSDQRSRYWQWPQYDKESYYYQGTTHLGETFTLKSRLYHDTFKNTLLMYNSLPALQSKNGSYSHYSDYSSGAGLQLASEIRDNDLLSFAVNWKDDVHREKKAPKNPYDRYKDRTWSLAAEYQWAAADNLDIVGGISYDWRNSLQAMEHAKNGTILDYGHHRQAAFNGEIMAKYHLENKDTLSLSWSDKTRFPTLKERYTTTKPATNRIALVNPRLKPERAQNFDLTWNSAIIQHWAWEASVYYNRVSDAILSQDIDANTTQNRNSGRVDYTGIDLGVTGDPWKKLEVGLNYGLIHASVKRKEAGKITSLPVQTLTTWLTFKPWKALRITFSEEARSASYSNSSATQKATGFAISHLRANYDIGHGLSINASINNLFDRKYALSEGFIEEGRNFWTGIEYKF